MLAKALSCNYTRIKSSNKIETTSSIKEKSCVLVALIIGASMILILLFTSHFDEQHEETNDFESIHNENNNNSHILSCEDCCGDDVIDFADWLSLSPPNNEYKLLQSHYITRHGDRIQLFASLCFNNTDVDVDVEFVCDNDDSLLQTISIQQAPLYGFKISPIDNTNILPGNCMLGQLTPKGYKQLIHNGNNMRQRYMNYYKLIPTQLNDENVDEILSKVRLRADNVDRVQQSVMAFFLGLYPNYNDNDNDNESGLKYKIRIPIFVEDRKYEIITDSSDYVCPILYDIVDDRYSSEEWIDFEQNIARPINDSIGDVLQSLDAGYMDALDCGTVYICHKYQAQIAINFTQELYDDAIDAALYDHLYQGLYPSYVNATKYHVGPFLKLIYYRFKYMIDKQGDGINSNMNISSLYVYGGHDTGPIIPLLSAFQYELTSWVPYAATITLELFQKKMENKQYFILISYNGKPLNIPQCQNNNGEKINFNLCEWNKFEKWINEITPTTQQCPNMKLTQYLTQNVDMNGNHAAPKSVATTTPPNTSMEKITDILIASIIGIDYLILLPIFIVCARILYKNRNIQVFRSRRPVTLQYIVYLTFIVFAVVEPYRLFDGSISNISYKIPFYISPWISSSIEYSLTLALLLCYSLRSYLIHYDFNYHEAILNNEWKQFTSRHQSQLEWYLKHRNTFGNRTFTSVIIFLIWLILSIFLTSFAYHFHIEAHWIIIQLIFFVLVEVFTIKLILRMPGLDIFRIRDEYMYLLAIILVLILTISCLLIFYDENSPNQIIISRLTYHLTAMIGTVSIVIISVIYPYRVHYSIQRDLNTNNKDISRRFSSPHSPVNSNKNKPNLFVQRVRTLSPKFSPKLSPNQTPKSVMEMVGVAASSPVSQSYSMQRKNSNGFSYRDSNRVALGELLKSFVGIEAFLKHLVKELSAENLFFLSDIMQYKNAFVCDGILDEIFGWNMQLPLDDIPKSHILSQQDHYLRSKIICDKYIRSDSEREINISYQTRCNIINAFDQLDVITKPDPITYCTRFDFAADEIRKLLADSFRRFCLTPAYKKFCRDYNTRVKRLTRRLSKSVKSFTRELSRDRSVSMDRSLGLRSAADRSPHLTRMTSIPSRSKHKLSDISEYKVEERHILHTILPPMSLSNHTMKHQHSNVLTLPETGSPIHTGITHNTDKSKSETGSNSHSNENEEKNGDVIRNSTIINQRTSAQRHNQELETVPSKTDHLAIHIVLHDYPNPSVISVSSDDEVISQTPIAIRLDDINTLHNNDILSLPAMTPPPIWTDDENKTDDENDDEEESNSVGNITPAIIDVVDKKIIPLKIIETNDSQKEESVDSQLSTAM